MYVVQYKGMVDKVDSIEGKDNKLSYPIFNLHVVDGDYSCFPFVRASKPASR